MTRQTADRVVVPGQRIGPIRASSREEELRATVGNDSIRRDTVHVIEDFCAEGSVLYPGTSDSVVVIWTDSTRQHPAEARISGRDATWRTPAGVGIGTTVAELETLAGRPVTFYGFEWDGSGLGRWTEEVDGRRDTLFFRVYPDTASIRRFGPDPRFEGLIGDVEVRSDDRLVREMVVPVRELSLRWSRPETFDCPNSLSNSLR